MASKPEDLGPRARDLVIMIALIAVVGVIALVLMGGQVSARLGPIGSSI